MNLAVWVPHEFVSQQVGADAPVGHSSSPGFTTRFPSVAVWPGAQSPSLMGFAAPPMTESTVRTSMAPAWTSDSR
ncbi:hypothetical protein ACFPRL_22060 [Pseudoclavibacter helvolus]